MTAYSTGSAAYQTTDINTSSPTRLVVMLYQGAIRFLNQAVEAIRQKDLSAKRASVDKTLAIIQHLQCTLDFEKAPAIAADLSRLYDYVSSRVLEGSLQLKAEPLEESVRLLNTLMESWAEVARKEEIAASAGALPAVTASGQFTLQA